VGVGRFRPAAPEGAWSVSQVTQWARQAIEGGFGTIWVEGEVSGFKAYPSGHWYFGLRDAKAQLRCVMFRRDSQGVTRPPDEGARIYCFGQPSVWEDRGEFRLTVRRLLSTAEGGDWKLALERARAALERDGLLDATRKRPLPSFPSRIAVVTSPDGAALRDIVTVLARRWPLAEVIVVGAIVQGDGAERSLRAALARLKRIEGLDLAIVGRGGGSREDLWAFNLESVARAVAAVPVPTVSAVGHEIDVTLCDLVADLRAPTPSAAAEAVVPDRGEVLARLEQLGRRSALGLERRTRYADERLARASDRLSAVIGQQLERRGARLAELGAQLDALSPLRVLERGYAVARDRAGRVLSRAVDLPAGQHFQLRVRDGEVPAVVDGPS
jgi:exodeoxyribonuclease VII large subunit